MAASVTPGSEPGTRPLPYASVAALYMLLLANAVVTVTPFPFLPFMVADFGYAPEMVGTKAGYIASARFAGNLCTAWLWGRAADRYGTRPCLLVSTRITRRETDASSPHGRPCPLTPSPPQGGA